MYIYIHELMDLIIYLTTYKNYIKNDSTITGDDLTGLHSRVLRFFRPLAKKRQRTSHKRNTKLDKKGQGQDRKR
jgi:hypothetical protein